MKVYIRFEFGQMVDRICVKGRKTKKTRPVRAKGSLLGLDFIFHLVKSSGDIHCLDAVFIFVSVCPKMESVDTKGSVMSTCLTAVVVERPDPLFPGLLVQLRG